MGMELIDDLKLNHIGIVVPISMKDQIEVESGELFLEDKIQGVSVCFVWDESLKLYKEYI